ncbi:MAG: hypothetical protein U1E17_16470 [Geminicoccaceae bacterium]
MAPLDLLVVNADRGRAAGLCRRDRPRLGHRRAAALAERFPGRRRHRRRRRRLMRQGEAPVVLPALPVALVSTHGAGDVFVGALRRRSPRRALRPLAGARQCRRCGPCLPAERDRARGLSPGCAPALSRATRAHAGAAEDETEKVALQARSCGEQHIMPTSMKREGGR